MIRTWENFIINVIGFIILIIILGLGTALGSVILFLFIGFYVVYLSIVTVLHVVDYVITSIKRLFN